MMKAPPTLPSTNLRKPAPRAEPRESFVALYLVTMRPYLLFVSGMAGVAGMAFAPALGTGAALAIFAGAFLSYGFGQALTDCFQMDTDRLSAPYRPLCRGALRRRTVLAVSLVGLAGCVAAFALYEPATLLLGALATAGLATYTWFKRRWWAGPFYNAWIVVVLSLMAYLAGTREAIPEVSPRFAAMLGAVFFGYANFVLSGYFKDIEADRSTGYRTLPVVYGRSLSCAVSDVFAALTLLCTVLAVEEISLPVVLFGSAGALALGVGQRRLHDVRSDEGAHRAIAPVVHAFLLLLSAVAVSQVPDWAPALAAFYVAFLATLRVRPARAQI